CYYYLSWFVAVNCPLGAGPWRNSAKTEVRPGKGMSPTRSCWIRAIHQPDPGRHDQVRRKRRAPTQAGDSQKEHHGARKSQTPPPPRQQHEYAGDALANGNCCHEDRRVASKRTIDETAIGLGGQRSVAGYVKDGRVQCVVKVEQAGRDE